VLDHDFAPAATERCIANAIEIKAIDRVNEEPLQEDGVLEKNPSPRHRIVSMTRIGEKPNRRVRIASLVGRTPPVRGLIRRSQQRRRD